MTRKRPWGIVFDKERLRAKAGAQPVWYVGDPSVQWTALQAAMDETERDPRAPLWQLTPFIERVGSLQSQAPNDWRWEREWRVQGDLDFDTADIAMIVVDDGGSPEFLDEVSVGVPWVSPDEFTVRWNGGFTSGWEAEIEGMLDRFREQFVSVDDAGLPWDSEDKEYVQIVEVLETWDAMEEAFGYLNQDLAEGIERALSGTSGYWCRLYDLEHAYE